MNITRHNCESFFLDYYEKTLSPVEVAEVLFFLEENPDLKEVFEGYEAVFLEQEKIKFRGKEDLKKKYSKAEIDSILLSEINTTNYEQFFIASSEELLSEVQNKKLRLFLAEQPELQKEFELFQKCKLTAENIAFEYKNLLKKDIINIQNREEYFIRAVENDLNPVEKKQFESFLKTNPKYEKEFSLFKKTILEPEEITFEYKSQLKKKERKPAFVYIFSQRSTYYGIAASILLFMGLFYFFGSNDNNKDIYLAEKHTSNFSNGNNANIKSPEEQNTSIGQVKAKDEPTQAKQQEPVLSHVNSHVKRIKSKQEIIIPQPVIANNNDEEKMIAKNEAEKKLEENREQDIAAVKTPEMKKDSVTTAGVVAKSEAMVPSVVVSKDEEYQTVSAFVNKKIRSILRISKSTECETSDKISVWDLAMVAKKEVQKVIGTKTLDVNKVCEGSGEKVEYVFTAGNFQISKQASK